MQNESRSSPAFSPIRLWHVNLGRPLHVQYSVQKHLQRYMHCLIYVSSPLRVKVTRHGERIVVESVKSVALQAYLEYSSTEATLLPESIIKATAESLSIVYVLAVESFDLFFHT